MDYHFPGNRNSWLTSSFRLRIKDTRGLEIRFQWLRAFAFAEEHNHLTRVLGHQTPFFDFHEHQSIANNIKRSCLILPAPGRPTALSEFKAILVYTVGFRTAKVT